MQHTSSLDELVDIAQHHHCHRVPATAYWLDCSVDLLLKAMHHNMSSQNMWSDIQEKIHVKMSRVDCEKNQAVSLWLNLGLRSRSKKLFTCFARVAIILKYRDTSGPVIDFTIAFAPRYSFWGNLILKNQHIRKKKVDWHSCTQIDQ